MANHIRGSAIERLLHSASPRTACLLLLGGVVLLTYGLPLALGWSWIPATNDPCATGRHAGPAFPPGADTWTYANVEGPWRAVEWEGFASGVFPLWNPYSSLGIPLGAQYENQLFFPVEWLEILAPPPVLNLLLLLKIYLAGLGCHLVLAKWLANEHAALAGSLFYIFTPPFVWFYSMAGFLTAAVILPWFYLCLSRLWHKPTLNSVGATALVVGMSFLAGQPQIAALNVLFASIYLLIKFGANVSWGSILKMAMLAGSLMLGLAMASLQIALFQQGLRHGHTLHSPRPLATAATAPLNLPVLLWPFLYGQLTAPWCSSIYPEKINWEGFPVVLGASGVFFAAMAVAGLARLRRARDGVCRVDVLAMAIVAAAILLWIVLATMDLIAPFWIPLLVRVTFPRYSAVTVSFALAVLVGLGVTQVGSVRTRPFAGGLLAMGGAVTAAGIYVLCHAAELVVGTLDCSPRYLLYSLWLGLVPFACLIGTYVVLAGKFRRRSIPVSTSMWCIILAVVSEGFFFVRMGLGLEDELARSLFVLVGCAGALLIAFRWTKCGVVLVAGGFVVLAFVLARSQHHLPPIEDVVNVPAPHIEFLQQRLGERSKGGRVLCSDGCALANSLNYYQLADLTGNQPVQVDSTAEFIVRFLPGEHNDIDSRTPNQWWGLNPAEHMLGWTDYAAKRRFFNLLSVRYLVDSPDGYFLYHSLNRVRLVCFGNRCCIYEDEDCSPRAYLCSSAVVVRDYQQALKLLEAGDGDFKTVPILEDPDGLAPGWLTTNDAQPIADLDISEYSFNRLVVPINVERSALVVLNDAFYPGWKAYVDGVEKPIFRMNAVCRGVVVEPGARLVEFEFKPHFLGVLATVSLTSFLVCMGLMSWHVIRRGLRRLVDTWPGRIRATDKRQTARP